MSLLLALGSLLLPWAAAAAWLGRLAPPAGSLHPSTVIGCGYLIGAAASTMLTGLALKFLPATAAPWVLTAVSLSTLAVALRPGARREFRIRRELRPMPGLSVATGCVLVLLATHLALGALEVLHRPVFPWDAWLNWMYRAKAWFYAGAVLPMDPVSAWAEGEASARYAVAGHHYPTFLPRLALTTILAAGTWSDTVANLPTLLLGPALALVIYGEARAAALGRTPALLAAYLLLSVPLLGAHLSLAGQSDSWMAATTGLGLACFAGGLARGERDRVALGTLLLLLATQVKLEGWVWAAAVFFGAGIARAPRLFAGALSIVAVILTALLAVGITEITLPQLGTVGLRDGTLLLPLAEDLEIRGFTLADDYLENFLLGGSWHLLWPGALAAAFFAAAASRGQRPQGPRLGLAIAGSALLAQLLIFGFTSQGAWAEDWTAINRLPLHFAPALVLGLVVMASRWAEGVSAPRLPRPAVISGLALGAAAMSGGAIWALVAFGLPEQPGPGLERTGASLRPMIGGGRLRGESAIIERFAGRVALVSTGPVYRDADAAGLVYTDVGGPNRELPTLFWRNGRGPDALYSLKLSGTGRQLVDLREHPGWEGRITELGVVFYRDEDRAAELHALAVRPANRATRLQALRADWTTVVPWSQRSVHWLPASTPASPLPPPLGALLWLACAGLLAFAVHRLAGVDFRRQLLLFAVIAWVALDARWLWQRAELTRATLADYPLLGTGPLEFGDDPTTAAAASAARCGLDPAEHRLLITSDTPESMRFQMLRAKYHALPVPAHVHEGPTASLPVSIADRVLILKQLYRFPGDPGFDADGWSRDAARGSTDAPVRVFEDETAVIFDLRKGLPRPTTACAATAAPGTMDASAAPHPGRDS